MSLNVYTRKGYKEHIDHLTAGNFKHIRINPNGFNFNKSGAYVKVPKSKLDLSGISILNMHYNTTDDDSGGLLESAKTRYQCFYTINYDKNGEYESIYIGGIHHAGLKHIFINASMSPTIHNIDIKS